MSLTKDEIRIAERNGISRSTAYVRVRKGMPVEQAITEPPSKKFLSSKARGGRTIGDTFVSNEHFKRAAENGINNLLVRQRILNGMSLEYAVTRPKRSKKVNQNLTETISEQELKIILGRIKHLRATERDFPFPYPKPMLERAAALGIEISKIKPIPVGLEG